MWFLWLILSNMMQRKHERAGTGLRRGWPVVTQKQDDFGRRLPLGEKEDGALQMVVVGRDRTERLFLYDQEGKEEKAFCGKTHTSETQPPGRK